MASIVKVRHPNGEIIDIPAFRGQPGPRGEQGIQGIQGIQGPKGDTGEKGADGVSSWNDLTDKPFGAEIGMVEILPECTPTYSDGMASVSANAEIMVGNTYTVNWGGTEYACVAQDLSALEAGATGIGNLTNFGGTSLDVPFAIVYQAGALVIATLDGSTDLTISIYGEQEIVTKLNSKYLPNEAVNVVVVTASMADDGTLWASHTVGEIRLAQIMHKAVFFQDNSRMYMLINVNNAAGIAEFWSAPLFSSGQIIAYYADITEDRKVSLGSASASVQVSIS